jgi:hypothetical protein
MDNSEVARVRMEYTYEFDSKKSPQSRGLKQMLSFDQLQSLHGEPKRTAN